MQVVDTWKNRLLYVAVNDDLSYLSSPTEGIVKAISGIYSMPI